MEIKNKLTVIREEGEGDKGGKEGTGQGMWIKDSWAQTMEWGLTVGVERVGAGESKGKNVGQL